MFKKQEKPQEKTPQQIVAEGDERRAQGEGLRQEEREEYNKARTKLQNEEFIRGEGTTARAVERGTKAHQEQREKAQEKIQQRIQKLEELVASRQGLVEDTKKEIAGLNKDWSDTDNPSRRSSLHLSVQIKEQSLSYYQKEFDQYSKELEEQKIEFEKSKL